MSNTAEFTVNLDAFAANLAAIRERVAPADHMLVVKDDAYAHGLAPIVERAWAEGVRWIGALDVATGMQVRQILGDEARIFAWMLQGPADVTDAVAARLDCGVGSIALLHEIAAGSAGERVAVHLKIDTGLHRNGVRPEAWADFVAQAREYELAERIRVVGIWSHIAEASDGEDDISRAVFDEAVAAARAAGLAPEKLHLAASAAAFARAEYRYDMVRIGAFAYGIRSTDGPSDDELGIRPIGTLRASVLPSDDAVPALDDDGVPPPVAVDLGWNGIPSLAAKHLTVQTSAGQRQVIRVTADVTLIEPWTPEPDEIVALLGGEALETATDLAERIGTIGEEPILRISPLIPRRYLP